MASTDVEDKTRDNILYDLTVHAEWKQENEVFVSICDQTVQISRKLNAVYEASKNIDKNHQMLYVFRTNYNSDEYLLRP